LLTGMKMDLVRARKSLDPSQTVAQSRIVSAIGLIDETIKTVRRIATELRPGVLDDLGLAAAIEWQVSEFQSRTGIACHFDARDVQPEYAQDVSITAFRILQEALTNVARHAQASEVHVTLEGEDGLVQLLIQDNGKGFSQATASTKKTYGLLGIQERACRLGGQAVISSSPGNGTQVSVSLPMSREQ
jgi:signal transduction histidine kinase